MVQMMFKQTKHYLPIPDIPAVDTQMAVFSIKQEPRGPVDNFDEGHQGFGDEGEDDAGKSKWDTSSDSELENIIKTKSGKAEQSAPRGMYFCSVLKNLQFTSTV